MPKKKESPQGFTIRIIGVNKDTLQEDGSQFLSVQFDILDGETVVQTRRLGFPFDADPDFITGECQAVADVLQGDMDLAEQNKAQEELNTKADETINALINE